MNANEKFQLMKFESFGTSVRVSVQEHEDGLFSVWHHEIGSYLADGQGNGRFSYEDAVDLAEDHAV